MKEILASTCYLTLCLRRVSHRGLVGLFVRFLLTETYDGHGLLDALVARLQAQTQLRLATLQLFHALVDLDCEDVMLALTMRHLLPCSHVMLSQRTNALQVPLARLSIARGTLTADLWNDFFVAVAGLYRLFVGGQIVDAGAGRLPLGDAQGPAGRRFSSVGGAAR